jgi:hypothetical protein
LNTLHIIIRRGVSETQANDEFIQVISQFPNRNAKISSARLRVLRSFITKPRLSTYQIQKAFKEKGENKQDEKIRLRVKWLHSVNLIEEIRNKKELKFDEKKRPNTVYFKLTTGGLFYLIYNDNYFLQTLPIASMKDIIRYHGNNIIFKTFLYHCLEKSTLLRIKGSDNLAAIFNVLSDSCEITDKIVDSLERCNDTSQTAIQLFNWTDIPERYDIDNLRFLDNVFDLRFGHQIRLEKIDRGKTLRILNLEGYEKGSVTLIKLAENKDRAFLTSGDGKQYELSIERLDNKLIVSVEKRAAKKYLLERFSNYVNRDSESLAFVLLLNLNLNVKNSKTREYDTKVLMNDTKFKHGNDEINES